MQVVLAFGVAVALFLPAAVAAQAAETAKTTLKIQDERGQPLAEVTVRIESAAGTSLVTTTSSVDGAAIVPKLPRGRHRVIVSDARGEIGAAVLVVADSGEVAIVTIQTPGAGSAHFTDEVIVSAEAGSVQESAQAPQSVNAISRD